MSEIIRDQIEHLAQLTHLNLTDEELDRVSGELDVILTSVAKVQQVATEDVPPTSHPIALSNVFRDDVVRGVLDQSQVFPNAPDTEDGHFKVPAILEGE